MTRDRSEYQKQYREKNKERLLELTRQWRKDNPDKTAVYKNKYMRLYYQRNKERMNAANKEWRKNNSVRYRETRREGQRRWRRELALSEFALIVAHDFHLQETGRAYGELPF